MFCQSSSADLSYCWAWDSSARFAGTLQNFLGVLRAAHRSGIDAGAGDCSRLVSVGSHPYFPNESLQQSLLCAEQSCAKAGQPWEGAPRAAPSAAPSPWFIPEAAHSCHQQGKSKCCGGDLHAVRGGFHRFLLLSHPQDAHLKRNKYRAWWLLQVKPVQKLLATKSKYTSTAASHSTNSHLVTRIYGSFFSPAHRKILHKYTSLLEERTTRYFLLLFSK